MEKIETVADYSDRSAKTIQFCKDNLEAAKSNPSLKHKARSKIRKLLLEGIEITDTVTGKTSIKKFDYPLDYISQVLNVHNRTYNKWVIICAINYREEYEEFEDPSLVAINRDVQRGKNKKTINTKEALAKRNKLVKRA